MHPVLDCPQCPSVSTYQRKDSAGRFPVPEKRKAGLHVRPNFDKTPIDPRFSAFGPGAIMRQLSAEYQPSQQQIWLFSNDRAETLRIV
jgi:hypothetical protein